MSACSKLQVRISAKTTVNRPPPVQELLEHYHLLRLLFARLADVLCFCNSDSDISKLFSRAS